MTFIFQLRASIRTQSIILTRGGTAEFVVGAAVASPFPFPATTVGSRALSLPLPLKRDVGQ